MSVEGAMDIRLPIGGLFSVLGVILSAYGVASGSTSSRDIPSLPINVNLWWGLVMLAFGLGLLLSATFYGKPSIRPAEQSPEGRATESLEHERGLET
jgi:hypothetical protein